MTNRQAFRNYMQSLLPVARMVERLAPSGLADQPNPEYPWEQGTVVIAPVQFSFPSLQLRDPKVMRILRFVEQCLDVV